MESQGTVVSCAVPAGPSVVAALRPASTTFALDGLRGLSFDREGRLIRAFWEGRPVRRSLDNRFVEKRKAGAHPWSHARRELGSTEIRRLLSEIGSELETVRRGLDRASPALPLDRREALENRLAEILEWDPEALAADGRRFRSVYLPIPILPPDQYGALVVQLTEGCSYNQCSFCHFYRDRTFRAKTGEELRQHVAAVREFFGAGLRLRTGIFLADANALVLSQERLLQALEMLRAELPLNEWPAGIYSFIDAFSGRPKSPDDFRALRERGLRRVYVGLESGSDELLRFLNKPLTAESALALVENLKSAGLGAGVIVLVGAGGDRYAAQHVQDTVALVNAMGLGPQDILYLSPLMRDPDSAYPTQERAAGIRPLTESEMDAQITRLKAGLRFPGPAPKVAVYDIRDFLY